MFGRTTSKPMGCKTQALVRVLHLNIVFSPCSPRPLKQRSGEQLVTPIRVLCLWLQNHIWGRRWYNLFFDALLENRRRSKKMAGWALELQQYNVVRVWLRGESNILGDAPSRAPWQAILANQLPIPDMPIRELVSKMYRSPEELDGIVKLKAEEWELLLANCRKWI